MFLHSQLTTIPRPDSYPTKIVDLGFRVGTKVSLPWLDAATCEGIVLPMNPTDQTGKDAVDALFTYAAGESWNAGDKPLRDATLAIALKVYYRRQIVFWGPLHAPEFDYDAKTITLAAHDPTLRMMHAYIQRGDSAIDPGITIDGDGILTLLDLAQNRANQDLLNWPSLGIVRGDNYSTDTATVRKLKAGDEIYQSMKELADLYVGPDYETQFFETDPAELASGTVTVTPEAAVPDNATTDYSMTVTLPGLVGELRVGVYMGHARSQDVNVELGHPDGTWIRLYTGSRDNLNTGTAFLGSGSAVGSLAKFKSGPRIYGTAFPHVGEFRSAAPTGIMRGKAAAGTWKLRIIDTTTGNVGTLHHWRLDFQLPSPAYARLNVYDKPFTDTPPAPVCTFYKGMQNENAKTLRVAPLGKEVRNQFIAAGKAATDPAVSVNDTARAEYGTYQGYEAGEDKDSADLLKAKADDQVAAYSRPLPSLNVAPLDDSGTNDTLRYGEDFKVGQHVRAIGKVGRAYHDVLARVWSVTLEQHESSVSCDMDVRPTVTVSTEIGVG